MMVQKIMWSTTVKTEELLLPKKTLHGHQNALIYLIICLLPTVLCSKIQKGIQKVPNFRNGWVSAYLPLDTRIEAEGIVVLKLLHWSCHIVPDMTPTPTPALYTQILDNQLVFSLIWPLTVRYNSQKPQKQGDMRLLFCTVGNKSEQLRPASATVALNATMQRLPAVLRMHCNEGKTQLGKALIYKVQALSPYELQKKPKPNNNNNKNPNKPTAYIISTIFLTVKDHSLLCILPVFYSV